MKVLSSEEAVKAGEKIFYEEIFLPALKI